MNRSSLSTASIREELDAAANRAGRPFALMEVCGTHTMAIHRHGLHALFPPDMRLVSGPGCPVCVTAQGQIDQVVALARRPDLTVATFGDMVRVPGTESSLERERARGADVRIVYSPNDAISLAAGDASREVVFIGIGFETTAPTIAGALLEARRRGLKNFSIVAAGKRVMPALEALVQSGEVRIDGLLCPGHVSVIIGSDAYTPLARDHGIPCVVAGFEPPEILRGCVALARQIADGRAEVENTYGVWVKPEGNRRALAVLDEVFEPANARWRGIGDIPGSGMGLRPEWAEFDATRKFDLPESDAPEPAGCRCGEVLRGVLRPHECGLFGRSCTPENPVGPCMVSSEGSCAAAYRYGRRESA